LMWHLLQVTDLLILKDYSCSLVTNTAWNIVLQGRRLQGEKNVWSLQNRDVMANVMRKGHNHSVCTAILWHLACKSVLLVVWKVLIMWPMRKVIRLVLLTSRWRPR